MDSNLWAGITRTIISGGLQSWEAYQNLLSSILSAGSRSGETKPPKDTAKGSADSSGSSGS